MSRRHPCWLLASIQSARSTARRGTTVRAIRRVEHLADRADLIDAGVARDEAEPARPPDRQIQAQRAGDHRVQAIRPDDDLRVQSHVLAPRTLRSDADDFPVVLDHRKHPPTLIHPRAGLFRLVQKDAVEDRPGQSERMPRPRLVVI